MPDTAGVLDELALAEIKGAVLATELLARIQQKLSGGVLNMKSGALAGSIGVAVDEGRALPTELERDRCEVRRGCGHDRLSRLCRAGEKDVVDSGADERLARLQRRGTLVVLVDSQSPSRGQCSVSVDDVLGGDLAVSHLLEAGHEQIAFVGGPLSIRQVADRRDGAVRALKRAGRAVADLHMIETPALNASERTCQSSK